MSREEMTAGQLQELIGQIVKEGYEVLSKQPLRKDSRPYDPVFAQRPEKP